MTGCMNKQYGVLVPRQLKLNYLSIVYVVGVLVVALVAWHLLSGNDAEPASKIQSNDAEQSANFSDSTESAALAAPMSGSERIEQTQLLTAGTVRSTPAKTDLTDAPTGVTIDSLISPNSKLYKSLLEEYKKTNFFTKALNDNEFVIARVHPKGDIIFTLYNHEMTAFARANPEAYFQKVQQHISALEDDESPGADASYDFLYALYQESKALRIDVVSSNCNGSKCYFEALIRSAAEADTLFERLESSSQFQVVITAVFSISQDSFVVVAYLNQ